MPDRDLLRTLIETWRECAASFQQQHEATIDTEKSYRFQGKARIFEACADDLEQALAASVVPVRERPPMTEMTFMDLDRASIRTGCETELNRAADMELRRRGYRFNAREQKWELPPAAGDLVSPERENKK